VRVQVAQDIDWQALWREAKRRKRRRRRSSADWDRRAAEFARRVARSGYTDKFLALMRPEPGWSILDVGCGPGTLALALAPRVRRVTCLDFSPAMLDILRDRARALGLTNIETRTLAWDDDWESAGVRPHDAAIASRSLSVTDLSASLDKLSRFARRAVFVTDRVGPGPMDPDAFAAVGRPLDQGPDFVYTLNLAIQKGWMPRLDYIVLDDEEPVASPAEALDRYRWMFPGLTAAEESRLQAYIERILETLPDGRLRLRPRRHVTWAFIWWPTAAAALPAEGRRARDT